jgi:hypothetical protein
MADAPKDLALVPQTSPDKDYFNIKVVGLKIDKTYSFQFQWILNDGTLSSWSPGYQISTPTESVPSAPSVTVPSTSTGNIPVTLSVFPVNAKRVDIYVIGGIYGIGKVVDSFFAAGTKTISISEPGTYQVSLITVTPSGINGDPTNTFSINVASATPEEIVPATIVSATATSGVNPLDSSGQLGYINLSITNGTIPSVFGGYIVKIQNSTNTWTQAFESKTALSSLYVNTGIMVGSTYTLSVATTNGKVMSNYVAVTGNPISVTDSRVNTSTVVGSLGFAATDSILTVSWSPSADAQVDSYRVQLTTNLDTSFSSPLQTIYTKSTNTSFGGLTASATYRVRVTTKYGGASGALSTGSTSGTVTLDGSGAISDGIAPTTNPVITTSNIKSLFGAFAITFPEVTNSDAVTYEVFIKPSDSTGIVNSIYKVLEVGGTFAVIKTLADKTTSLSYGTDYYIAIRAKDNDGVSTGSVVAVGPVQTTQVSNSDLAADSVYANNIKAGEIDASKMVTDLLFANKTINVGESTSLNRIRLDAVPATVSTVAVKSRMYIGAGNYYDAGTSFFVDNTGRFSISDKLKYDSTNGLVINGSGTFSGLLTTGSGLNTIKVGTGVNGSNNGIYIGSTGDYIYTDGTLRLGNGGLTYSGGVLSVSGNITANAIAANTSLSGLSISGTTGTFGGVTLNSSGISSTNFSITSTGYLTAQSGKIGGWDIDLTKLQSTASNNGQIALYPITANGGKIALMQSGVEKITIDPVEGIVGPTMTVAGNTGPAFKITPGGTAEFRGAIYASTGTFSGTVSGATVTGSKISTVGDTYFGSIRIGYTESYGSGSTLEVVGADNTVYGQLYQFNNGNELILRHGSSREIGGYPTSSAYLSLNPYSVSLGYTNSIGSGSKELTISASGNHTIDGSLTGIANGTVASSEFRNISAGSGVQSTTSSSNGNGFTAYIGDIYIQY